MKSVKIVNARIVRTILRHQKRLETPTAAETVAVIIRDYDQRQKLTEARKAARKRARREAKKK